VSAPPSAGQTVRNIAAYSHFDNGWVKSSTDPWDIATTYDYNPLGQQTGQRHARLQGAEQAEPHSPAAPARRW
jgi:hypothetical protein